MAQVVEIEGTVNGDIDFLGQLLTVKKGGVVEGEIRCRMAQVVQIEGDCGDVTGTYDVLNWPDRPATPNESAAADAEAADPPGEIIPD